MKAILQTAEKELHCSPNHTFSPPAPTPTSSRYGSASSTIESSVTSSHLGHSGDVSNSYPKLSALEHSSHAFLPTFTGHQFHYPHNTSSFDDVRTQTYKYYQSSCGAYSNYLSPSHARTAPYPLAKPSYGAASNPTSHLYADYSDSRYALFESR